MKHRLLKVYYISYLVFLALSFSAAMYVTPKYLKSSLYAISEEAEYRNYLASQSVAIQNVCYILFGIYLVLSILPLVVFQIRIYRPLSRIVEAAAGFSDNNYAASISYEGDDELGDLSASLNYMAESLRSTGESQRKFISNISHDFRSPLTSIKGYVEAMLDGTIPPEMQEKYLKIVLGETERLNKLTEGLLTLNSFDDQGVYLERTDFDVIGVINNSIAAFEGQCRRKNVKIETVYAEETVLVNADMAKIQQVLYNLIDNAIKFCYADSEIWVKVSRNRKKVFVSVKDHGEGISRENLPKIWNRFFKTDASRGRDKKGTGLGLSIVKEIIRAHDQNINVVSTEGVGTEFVFTLQASEKDKK